MEDNTAALAQTADPRRSPRATPNGAAMRDRRGEMDPEEFAFWRGQTESRLSRIEELERKIETLDTKVDSLKLRVAAIVAIATASIFVLELALNFFFRGPA